MLRTRASLAISLGPFSRSGGPSLRERPKASAAPAKLARGDVIAHNTYVHKTKMNAAAIDAVSSAGPPNRGGRPLVTGKVNDTTRWFGNRSNTEFGPPSGTLYPERTVSPLSVALLSVSAVAKPVRAFRSEDSVCS